MNYPQRHPLDEILGLHTPEEIDTNKTNKYLKDVEHALRSALKVAKLAQSIGLQVRVIHTPQDPKEYSYAEIQSICL